MAEKPSAYPLAWPAGWPRTALYDKRNGAFSRNGQRITIEAARYRLSDELDRLPAYYVVLSSNVPMRLDGKPSTNLSGIEDVGVCCYFQLGNKPISLPCDRYKTVPDNIAAIAAHISATRAIERHGVGSLEKMFAGFMALPAPEPPALSWWKVLGIPADVKDIDYAEFQYRKLMKEAHPDVGGSQKRASELNLAIGEARKVLSDRAG